DFTPANMWHCLRCQLFNCAWPFPHAVIFAKFFGSVEQVLVPHTYAKHGATTSHALSHPAGNAESFHGFLGGTEGSVARQDHSLSGQQGLTFRGHNDVST